MRTSSVSRKAALPPLRVYLDAEYLHDIRLLQIEFRGIDPADPASLRAWFLKHPYLVGHELAAVACVCARTVQRWKRRVGLPAVPRRSPPGWRRPTPAALVAPPDWRDGTWPERQYAAGVSLRRLAQATGRSYTAIHKRLRHATLRSARDAVASFHPCCTRAFLVENYSVRGLSLTRCARLARISSATLTDWLVRHEIRIRSSGEQLVFDHAARRGAAGACGFIKSE
jgi:hypothetical protein